MKKTIWIVLFALAGLHVQAQEEVATSSRSLSCPCYQNTVNDLDCLKNIK